MAALNGDAGRPVIGYTIELQDPMLLEVEPSLRAPLQRFGAVPVVLPRATPADASTSCWTWWTACSCAAAPTCTPATTATMPTS